MVSVAHSHRDGVGGFAAEITSSNGLRLATHTARFEGVSPNQVLAEGLADFFERHPDRPSNTTIQFHQGYLAATAGHFAQAGEVVLSTGKKPTFLEAWDRWFAAGGHLASYRQIDKTKLGSAVQAAAKKARSGGMARPLSPQPVNRPRPAEKAAPQVEELLTRAEMIARYSKPGVTGWFTDGSCSPNPGPGGWGVVYLVDSTPRLELHGSDPDTTNNEMELTAIVRALEAIAETCETSPTVLYSDSKYCINTLGASTASEGWARRWKKNGWKKKGGVPPKNLDLVQRAFGLRASLPHVTLEHVPGHSGDYGNEFADCLATAWMRGEF